MSDVVAAALIAASIGVIGNGLTPFVALTATARQSRADADRLRDEHREADRRVRRDAYARLLVALERLDLLTSAYTPPPTVVAYEEWLQEFRAAGVGVRLVESQAVGEARRAVARVLDALVGEVMRRTDAGQAMEDALGIPYVATRPAMHAAGRELGNAMRSDLAFAADATAA